MFQKVRKEIKRNRKRKRVRRKDWMAGNWEDEDHALKERVLPRGERERRRRIWNTALGQVQEAQPAGGPIGASDRPAGVQGVVTQVSTGLCRVDLGGSSVLCEVRGTLSAEDTGFTNVVAVGDDVVISLDGGDRGVLETVLPRRSTLARPDVFYRHLQHVAVANAEQLLAVHSWREPALWPELVDRYLIAAERGGLAPVICVNKVDLATSSADYRAALEPYIRLGYSIHFTSAKTGEGIGFLGKALRGRKTVLAGLSGVGKSSLISAVQPGLELRIGVVSDRRHEGRHTTAQVSMMQLDMGGWVVDTPGIREFGLSGLCKRELCGCYPEFRQVGRPCQFKDCSHTHEPGCAVRAAVRSGQVCSQRYANYIKIHQVLPA
jgi:ribosome biogenesis GTPase